MKRSRTRARIVDSFFRSSLGLMICAIALVATAAQSAEVTLPYANFGGYQTALVMNNPGPATVSVPDFWRPFDGAGGRPEDVAARATYRFVAWPKSGGGVASFDVPIGLEVYTEITDPNGVIVRIRDMGAPFTVAVQAQDLLTTDGFRTFVFLVAGESGAVELRWYQDAEELGRASYDVAAGQVIIPEVPAGNRVVIYNGDPRWAHLIPPVPYRAFVLISHQPGGELLTAPLFPIQ